MYGNANSGASDEGGGAIDCAKAAAELSASAKASQEGFTLLMLPLLQYSYLTLFIHFKIGPLTDVSGLPGENTSDMWLWALNISSVG